jgi:hypothetical protein
MKERLPPTRVLVTGSREWTDRGRLERELLDELVTEAHEWGVHIRCGNDVAAYLRHQERKHWIHFILGDCKTGADWLARKWCEEHGVSHEVHEVSRRFERAESEIQRAMFFHHRNQRMVTEGKPDRYVAFWDGRRKPSGTCDTMARCTEAGVPGRTVPQSKRPRQLDLNSLPRLTNFESPRRGPSGDEDSG